jgi:O-antigen ligase
MPCDELKVGPGESNWRADIHPNGGHGRSWSLSADSLLLAILSPFLTLSVGWLPRVLLGIVLLDIPIQFGTHLYYSEKDAAMGALGGLSVSATTIAVCMLYFLWFLRAMTRKGAEESGALHFNIPLAIYLVISVLSVAVAQDATLAWFEVILLVEACLIYFYIANTVRTRQDVLFVFAMLTIGCLLESMVMIVMWFTVTPSTTWDLPIHLHAEGIGNGGLMRLGGTVGSSNFAAAYLSISIASAASALFTDLGKIYKWPAIAVLGLGSVALVLTFSRGGWMALALSLLLICGIAWKRRGFSLKAPIAIVVILSLLYIPFHEVISERLFGDDRGSAESRIPLMNLALRIIEDNPLLGVGANNFTVAMDRYLTSEFRQGFLFAVHNKYLLVLAETGIGGLLALLAFLVGTIRKAWQCWRVNDRLFSPLALGFAAGITGHMLHMTVDVFRGRPTQQLLWVIAGLVTAMHKMCATSAGADLASARN